MSIATKRGDGGQTGLAGGIRVSKASLPFQPSPDTEYQLLRIAKEAIANSIRHAEPKTIEVRLECKRPNLLELTVRDDGKGFDADGAHSQLGHYGLIGMKERAEELGAKLTVTSIPGAGTEIRVMAAGGVKTKPAGDSRQSAERMESLEKQKA